MSLDIVAAILICPVLPGGSARTVSEPYGVDDATSIPLVAIVEVFLAIILPSSLKLGGAVIRASGYRRNSV